MTKFALSPEREKHVEEILSRYPNSKAACIPVLHVCQEQNGWISEEVMQFVADRLSLSTAHVTGVVTFHDKGRLGKFISIQAQAAQA